jgi:hypothetical protein
MVPLLPLVLLFAYKALALLEERFHLRRSMVTVSLVALFAMAAHALIWQAKTVSNYQAAVVPYEPPPDWNQTRMLLEWIRNHTDQKDVFMRNDDPMVYLYTGRKALRGFLADPYELFYAREPKWPLGPPSHLLKEIARWHVNYIVTEPNSTFEEGPYLLRLIDAARAEYPSAFEEVWVGPDPRYRIYKVNRNELPYASPME